MKLLLLKFLIFISAFKLCLFSNNSSYVCTKKVSHCKSCDNRGYCNSCESGYTISKTSVNGELTKVECTSTKKILIIFFSIFAAVCIVIGIIITIYCKYIRVRASVSARAYRNQTYMRSYTYSNINPYGGQMYYVNNGYLYNGQNAVVSPYNLNPYQQVQQQPYMGINQVNAQQPAVMMDPQKQNPADTDPLSQPYQSVTAEANNNNNTNFNQVVTYQNNMNCQQKSENNNLLPPPPSQNNQTEIHPCCKCGQDSLFILSCGCYFCKDHIEKFADWGNQAQALQNDNKCLNCKNIVTNVRRIKFDCYMCSQTFEVVYQFSCGCNFYACFNCSLKAINNKNCPGCKKQINNGLIPFKVMI